MIRTGNMRKLTYKNERLDSSCQRSRVSRSDREVSRNGANATMVEGTPEAMTNRALIADLIGAAGLPAIHRIPKFVDAGHLMAYSIDVAELNKRAANTIDASFAARSKLEVRVFHQPQDREGAWHRRPGNAPGQRRQRHRMKPPPNVALWHLTVGSVSPNVRFAAPNAAILEQPAFVPKRRSCRNSTAALLGFANEMGMLPLPRLQGQQLNYRSRLRPVEPSCSRAAGIAARGDAARAGRGARTDPGRGWTAVPPGL